MSWRRLAGALIISLSAALLGLVGMDCLGASSPPVEPRRPKKRALLVAVGAYAPGTGWATLSSRTDLDLVGEALRHHGFDSIRELEGSKATRAGILRAIEEHLLTPAQDGDVLVLLLSGHGQRLTDGPDADELDGYDETFVPWDAPMEPPAGYKGQKHLRDDELGELVDLMRRKAGSAGDVLVLLDSCFSGTGTRGTATRRGGPPLGPPRAGVAAGAGDYGGGFQEVVANAGSSTFRPLAPQAFFAAARNDQEAYQTKTVDGDPVGPLSRAFARALLTAGLDPTYRGLAEEIRWEMASYRPAQQPQAEGDLDRGLFGGRAVRPAPYFEIVSIDFARKRLKVRPGSLAGLQQGAEVEIHAPGTVTPTGTTRLGEGRVMHASHGVATVQFSGSLDSDRPMACRVFVTRYFFGDLRMRVKLEPPPVRGGRAVFGNVLESVPSVELVRTRPEIIVDWIESGEDQPERERGASRWVIRDSGSGRELARGRIDQPDSSQALAGRLRSLARNRYLRRVKLFEPRVHVGFEVVPVTISDCRDPDLPSPGSCTVTVIKLEEMKSPGGSVELPIGSYFQLRLQPGKQSVYIAVLDLMADGQIEVLWPPRGAEVKLSPGEPRLLPLLYEIVEPTGPDQLMLVASQEFLDFRPFRWVEQDSQRRGPTIDEPRRLNPFEPLFDDELVRTRSHRVGVYSGLVSAARVTIHVVEAGGRPQRSSEEPKRKIETLEQVPG